MSIYLDYNATAPMRAEAVAAMQAAMGPPVNASSVHNYGRSARQKIEQARGQVADLLAVRHHDLIFTSGGTEANNMVLRGFGSVVVSAVEHDAVLAVNPDAHRLPVTEDGIVRPDTLERFLSEQDEDTRADMIVSIMGANNETGVCHPIAALAEICQRYDVPMHSDMVQLAGKAACHPANWGLSFASFSAHKLGGPTGVGALWVKPGLTLPALMVGGGQEQGRRSGTENALGIIGFGAAAAASQVQDWSEIERIRDAAAAEICEACPDITWLGKAAPKLPNTICLGLPNLRAETLVMALDLQGFAVSSGAACSSGKVQESHVISAMGYGDLAGSILRISAGWHTTENEMQKLAAAVIALYKQLTS